jgi:methylthioribose-1-phosphate isomerase
MHVDGVATRTIWPGDDRQSVFVIDQRQLPHAWRVMRLASPAEVHRAIAEMWVRGAPLIGVTAAFGVALQCAVDASEDALTRCAVWLNGARPTAVNLAWATQRMVTELLAMPQARRSAQAFDLAQAIAEEDVTINSAIGDHGLALLRTMRARSSGGRLNLLTHCNAGWLATVDWGTALAPIYKAHAAGLEVHVWVDETRPRNQGASLTAWELAKAGVAHTLVADNAGGHLMQHGQVDAVIVGCDRVGAGGDVCNKIGTYLKALAARDNGVPFYVAMPLSTLDTSIHDALAEIPIERRPARELTHIVGLDQAGQLSEVALIAPGTEADNPAFDVTPARLVSALITEVGVIPANREALLALRREAE